ncbi:MAG: cytochrome B6 [Planctomycetes bacterium]|nr:cytochrome B6 [Planctomycetota bacterium]
MTQRSQSMIGRVLAVVVSPALVGLLAAAAVAQPVKPAPPSEGGTYIPVVPTQTFEQTFQKDTADKAKVQSDQQALLDKRYDLRNDPSNVQMSGQRKAVQQGVRVKLHGGANWASLGGMTPEAIKSKNLFPYGFRPLPHVKHPTGGMVFPKNQIDEIKKQEARDLARFDVDFDLPDHITPEFPPPMFLTSRPDLGDVSNGEVLTSKNYYRLLYGKVTPVQMEGMRLLLTPNPQQQFNQTEDRKVKDPSFGVTCLDCHVNGHTNATFHENPDTRPQSDRMRIETVSLRGMFNQQIHGSKRSLRSIEDFTEFEQRTAYFDGDQVTAAKKGLFLPERSAQVAMMAQMQNMLDFPPAPKLDVLGRLIPSKATQAELEGEKIFHGKGRCAECHKGPFFIDDKMHDLHLERFYEAEMIGGQRNIQDGPIKTFTLRGIKDSPPYHHDGRLMTLEDTVEFFNLVLTLKLSDQEKSNLVAFLRCL